MTETHEHIPGHTTQPRSETRELPTRQTWKQASKAGEGTTPQAQHFSTQNTVNIHAEPVECLTKQAQATCIPDVSCVSLMQHPIDVPPNSNETLMQEPELAMCATNAQSAGPGDKLCTNPHRQATCEQNHLSQAWVTDP